jgi:ribosome-associated protein
MIRITRNIKLDEAEIEESFIRASGPGGQNVNKTATAVQLRFKVTNSPSLPDPVKQRLLRIAGKRIDARGVLTIEARRYREQPRNREDALERLVNLIRKAAERPAPRVKTKPTRAAKERRLEEKRKRGETKKQRRRIGPRED